MATCQKRGNSYYIRATNGYDNNHHQIVHRMTWKPQKSMTERQIQKELDRVMFEFDDKVKGGDFEKESKMRLADFCPLFLENVTARLSPLTLKSYKNVIERYIIPQLGPMKLIDIKPKHVQSFVNSLQSFNTLRYKKLSNTTIKRVYSVLQAILHDACKMDLIPRNPANHEKIDLPVQKAPKVDIFAENEVKNILKRLNNEPLKWQVLINMALAIGCRRGELLALHWHDIDLKKGIVSIDKSIYALKGRGIQTKEPKTAGSVRIVAIPQFVVAMLRDYRQEQMLLSSSLGDQWQEGDWIFTQWNGAPMYPSSPTQWFSKFLNRNGFKHRRFHALRHTSASILNNNGANIKTIGARLGHAKISTTLRYLHEVSSEDYRASQTFETLFADQV